MEVDKKNPVVGATGDEQVRVDTKFNSALIIPSQNKINLEKNKADQQSNFNMNVLTQNPYLRFTPLMGKKPFLKNWTNNPLTHDDATHYIPDNNATGLGLLNEHSKTCSIDIDQSDKAETWLSDHGVDLGALLNNPNNFRIHSPKKNSEKLIFSLDEVRATIQIKDNDGAVILEFRCKGSQDAWVGAAYQYTDEHFEGEYVHSGSTLIPKLPQALQELWGAQLDQKPKDKPITGEDEICEDLSTIQQATSRAKTCKPAIEGQGGDYHTFGLFMEMHNLGLTEKTALAIVDEHFNSRCVPPWSTHELQAKCKSGYKNAKQPMGSTSVSKRFRDFLKANPSEKAACSILAPTSDYIKHNKNTDQLIQKVSRKIESKLQGSGYFIRSEALDSIANTAFYAPSKQKVIALNPAGNLINTSMADFIKIIPELYGYILDFDSIKDLYRNKGITDEDTLNKLATKVNSAAIDAVRSYLLVYRQYDKLVTEVDLFAESPMLKTHVDYVTYKTVHHPFKVNEDIDPTIRELIVADYSKHFPMFKMFIELILAARVASDRRHAFYLLQAISGWGKGFLLGVLKKLGLAAELSIAEIEKALTGAPFGKDISTFLRAWVLVVDEFKNPKGDLKMLNSEISYSPKNQLSCTSKIYMKLFTFAEDIDALQGEYGVESQFGNRFAYINVTETSIDDRPLFKKVGKSQYRNAITSYTADYLNMRIDSLRIMGKAEATKWGDSTLEGYHANNRIDIDNLLSDSVRQLAKEFSELVRETMMLANSKYDRFSCSTELGRLQQKIITNTTLLESDDIEDLYLVKSVATLLNAFLNTKATKSEITKISHKRNEIAIAADYEGKPYRRTRILPGSSKRTKGLLIQKDVYVIPPLITEVKSRS